MHNCIFIKEKYFNLHMYIYSGFKVMNNDESFSNLMTNTDLIANINKINFGIIDRKAFITVFSDLIII